MINIYNIFIILMYIHGLCLTIIVIIEFWLSMNHIIIGHIMDSLKYSYMQDIYNILNM